MKRPIALIVCTALIICSGCTVKNPPKPQTASADTTVTTAVNAEELQKQLSDVTEKYKKSRMIYDSSLKNAVNTYCEYFLTFDSDTEKDLTKIKDAVTPSYYTELQSQTGHAKNNSDKSYEQTTGVDSLYYSDYSESENNVKVLALCKQTILYDDEAHTGDVTYIFNMVYDNSKWLINSVDIKEE